MKRKFFCAAMSLAALATAIFPATNVGAFEVHMRAPVVVPVKPRQIKIDLDKAVPLKIPQLKQDLTPYKFKTPDGKECWALRVTGGRPIATPAFWNGMIFVGGGYGSHEFYAFNAATGALVWKFNTNDDGPSAAVVENGYVAFNTESCTVFVLNATTGKLVWQEWLGDPLMSQPAIAAGRLYISYPASGRGMQALHKTQNAASQVTIGPSGYSHRLLCADLRTGKHLWECPIPADAVTAPVVSRQKVYVTCMDGTSMCMDALKGTLIWTKKSALTSAPLVVADQMIITEKTYSGDKVVEGVRRMDAKRGEVKDNEWFTKAQAPYLSRGKGGGVALSSGAQTMLDSAVGFSSAPLAANLTAAASHLGVSTVVAGWAYQGSRAAYGNGQIVNAQGNAINSMRATDGSMLWKAEVMGHRVTEDGQAFSPPALGKKNLYLCGAEGHLLSVTQTDGKVNFLYATDDQMAFQPALAEGNLYAGTNTGTIICVKTGDADADGWSAWGGNAQHNKNDSEDSRP